MATKEFSAKQTMLSNKHLKEWNDNVAAETEALYQLRCQHGVERDQLAFDKIADHQQQRQLINQQQDEVNRLKRQHSERRIALQQRHLIEENPVNKS